MDGGGNWWADLQFRWRYFFDPDNPFIAWLLIFDLVLLLAHLIIVYWVYRDAMTRYNRGAPWAVLAAVLPVAGWLFYLLYRGSPLVQFDRIEAELFDESEQEWTDYDAHRASQGAALFQELGSLWRKPEGSGYSPWVRRSRERELSRSLTPEERQARVEERRKRSEQRRAKRAERRAQARQQRKQRASDRRERTTMTGAHGFTFRLSERRQRGLKRRLELVDKLKNLPREDERLEELIYAMQYEEALRVARESLAVAEEMADSQGVITYRAYVERLTALLEREGGEAR